MTVEPTITLFSVLLVAGAAQGLFLVLILLTLRHGHHLANRFLALWIFIFSLELLDEFFLQSGYYVYFPKASVLNWACEFLYGPLIFLYARALTQNGNQAREGAWPWLHGVPFVLSLTVGGVLWISLSEAVYLEYLFGSQKILLLVIFDVINTLLALISMVAYLLVTLRLLRRHVVLVEGNFSYSEKLSLRWLRNLVFSFSGLYLAYVYTLFFTSDYPWNEPDLANQVFYTAVVLSIFAWGFFGARQPVIFSRQRLYRSEEEGTEVIDAVPVSEKQRSSPLRAGLAVQDITLIVA